MFRSEFAHCAVVVVVVGFHYKRLRDIHDFFECFAKFGIEDGVDNRIYKTMYWKKEEKKGNIEKSKKKVANIMHL